jgi:hypothetical protein
LLRLLALLWRQLSALRRLLYRASFCALRLFVCVQTFKCLTVFSSNGITKIIDHYSKPVIEERLLVPKLPFLKGYFLPRLIRLRAFSAEGLNLSLDGLCALFYYRFF